MMTDESFSNQIAGAQRTKKFSSLQTAGIWGWPFSFVLTE